MKNVKSVAEQLAGAWAAAGGNSDLHPHVLDIDDPAMREFMADYLRENDLRVTAVVTGDEMPES